MQVDGLPGPAQAQIEHLDEKGEGHGEVNVVLHPQGVSRFRVPSFGHQQDADEDEKGEGQHFDGGVAADKIADPTGEDDHDAGRNQDGCHHDDHNIGNANGRYHRIQRENKINHEYLRHHRRQRQRRLTRPMLVILLHFQLLMDFIRAFPNQKKPAQ